MSKSPNLSLPYIMPAQAQKHVTHNLALEMLDALVQLNVTDLEVTEPPVAPFDGQVVVVGAGATGEFREKDGNLAFRTNGGWLFVPPRNGFRAWVEAEGAFYVHQDGLWRRLLTVGDDRADGLGLNTDWDFTNRLSVSSPATLLTHEGAGHRLKVNKAGAGDTASLLFQTGFSGRAEMGLAGNDDFSVKVSADGEAWSTAFSVKADAGEVEMGHVHAAAIAGGAVQVTPTDTTPGRLMRVDWGYGPGNAVGAVSQTDGVPTGAIVESGENADGSYTRWADGTQICTRQIDLRSGDYTPGRYDLGSQNMPASFAVAPTVSATSSIGSVLEGLVAATTIGCTGGTTSWDRVHLYVRPDTISSSNNQILHINLTAFGRWY